MCSLASVVLTASLSFCSSMGVFFFKQKTAYELRISDWSSDVCSSDLVRLALDGAEGGEIVMPDQPLGGQVHCVCIKVRENTPRKPCIQRQRRAAIDDAIFIRPPNAGKAGMPVVVHGAAIDDRHRIWAKLRVQRDRKRTRLNSSHSCAPRMPASA